MLKQIQAKLQGTVGQVANIEVKRLGVWSLNTHIGPAVVEVDDALEVVLVLPEPPAAEEPDHDLGDGDQADHAEDHRHGPEGEQLGPERPPVLLQGLQLLETKSQFQNSKKSALK